jgi:ferritin-like metal-binding protein YciE
MRARRPVSFRTYPSHLAETQGHAEKLETVFESIGERVRGKHCAGIAGIIEEASDLINEDFDGAVLDAGIIAGAQRAEHYEMGAYGSVIAWARVLGLNDAASTLEEILAEEKAADKKLSALAESSINAEAASEGGEEEDDEEDSEDEESKSRSATSGANSRSAKGSNSGSSRSASPGTSAGSTSRARGSSRRR